MRAPDVHTVTWTYRPDRRMGATVTPRQATCLTADAATEIETALTAVGHIDLAVTVFTHTDPAVA